MLNRKVLIGVDCDENRLALGFVAVYGNLKGLTQSPSLLPDKLDAFGRHLYWMTRGLRGCTNQRMKNFQAIGIGLPKQFVCDATRESIQKQMKEFWDIPIYLDDRELLEIKGKTWLTSLAHVIDSRSNPSELDLSIIYGAAKMALDNTPLAKYP